MQDSGKHLRCQLPPTLKGIRGIQRKAMASGTNPMPTENPENEEEAEQLQQNTLESPAAATSTTEGSYD
jgi:hypothetical protein